MNFKTYKGVIKESVGAAMEAQAITSNLNEIQNAIVEHYNKNTEVNSELVDRYNIALERASGLLEDIESLKLMVQKTVS